MSVNFTSQDFEITSHLNAVTKAIITAIDQQIPRVSFTFMVRCGDLCRRWIGSSSSIFLSNDYGQFNAYLYFRSNTNTKINVRPCPTISDGFPNIPKRLRFLTRVA
jgi:hypothetical protein